MNRTKWLQKPNLSLRWCLTCGALWSVLFGFISVTKVADELESKVSLPYFFQLRDNLGWSPKLNEKIKIFAMDDSSVASLGRTDLGLGEWETILKTFNNRGVSAVFVDGLFSKPRVVGKRLKAIESFNKLTKSFDFPLYVGSFPGSQAIKFRRPIVLNKPLYDFSTYWPDVQLDLTELERRRELVPLKDLPSRFVYGPENTLQPGFSSIGHILYFGDGRFFPLVHLGENKILPHMMVLAAKEKVFRKDQLFLDGNRIPIRSDGSALVNFSSQKAYAKRTKPLRLLLNEKSRKSVMNSIEPADFVYIIPSYYTGNTDFKLTPFGHMPGGFAHLAVLNSIIGNNWLSDFNFQLSLIVCFSLIAVLFAKKVSALGFSIGLITATLCWTVLCFVGFAVFNLVIPMILPLMSFLAPFMTVFAEKSRISEKKAQYVRDSLQGSVRPEELNKIAKLPNSINFDAKERVVTVMFIDVVGFSLLAENQLPRIAFESLKSVLADISTTVHDHGGIVNRNLGDGLLCFFGYSLEKDTTSFDHAEKAMACAVAIQRANLPKMLEAYAVADPVYPLRIGINTSSVYLGDIGTKGRLDFTVVGNGVNYAKRLEGACSPHSVMIGTTTRDLIDTHGLYQHGLQKRLIEIKHYNEMVEAWEYDPFWQDSKLREKAEDAQKKSTKMARAEKRWQVDRSDNLIVTTDIGPACLVNFSTTGLSIKLNKIAPKGTILSLSLDSQDGILGKTLKESNLIDLSVEVRWGFQDGRDFLHGVQFDRLTEEETAFITEQLCEHGLRVGQQKSKLNDRPA